MKWMLIRNSGILPKRLNELGHNMYLPFLLLHQIKWKRWMVFPRQVHLMDESLGIFNRTVAYNVLNNFFFFFLNMQETISNFDKGVF